MNDRPWGGHYTDTGQDCPHCAETTLISHGGKAETCIACGHIFANGIDLVQLVRRGRPKWGLELEGD